MYVGETLPVTFPSSLLTARVYIALGADLTAGSTWWQWNWADITSYVRQDLGVTIVPGRRDESTLVTASAATLKLDNRDGRFSRRNPLSPYFGLLTKNTPIWIQIDPGSGFVDRYFGYVNEWPTRWSDASGNDSYVTIRCAGVMRRLLQGENLEASLNRTILADSPVHYWRIDDPSGSTSAASSLINGGTPMDVFGTVVFGDLQGPPGGSTTATRMDSGSVFAEGLNVAAPWTVEWSILRPTNGSADSITIFQAIFSVSGADTAFGVTLTQDTTVSARDWYHYKIEAVQNGSNYEIYGWKNGTARGLLSSGAGTLGVLRSVDVGNLISIGGVSGFGAGYVATYPTGSSAGAINAANHSAALQAFNGEQAHVRVARLCAEAGVPVRVLAPSSALMGTQGSGTLLALLRECEEADQGVLYEHEFGLAYQSRYERYNQSVALALDFDQGHIAGTPEPADDDQRLRNQWTVTRADSFASRTARDQDSVDASGLFDDGKTVSLDSDGVLLDHASWRVHVGTVDEDRWPRAAFQLHRPTNSALLPAWLTTPLGSRVTIANPPSGSDAGAMAPDVIDQILEGYTEHFDQVKWDVSLNMSPASPYRIAILDDPAALQDTPRVGSATATLSAGISDSDTSISAATGSDGLWTTDAADFPMDINVGGERIRLSAISGASSPQTFTVSARSVNGMAKAHLAGARVEPWQTATIGL